MERVARNNKNRNSHSILIDMKQLITFAQLMLIFLSVGAQSYDDVAVIINENSEASIEIGTYFAEARDIPLSNLIYVNTTVDEVIDSLGFVSLKNQIKSAMRAQNLDGDNINYLVTTKGIPFNLEIGDCNSTHYLYYDEDSRFFSDCSCVESDLQLLFHPDSSIMANSGSFPNPYFEKSDNFSHSQYGTYLVSRLDGYNVTSVKDMIDRSGPNVENTLFQYPAFIFDVSYSDEPMVSEIIVNKLTPAIEYLESYGCNVILDTLQEMPTIYGPVMSYHTWNFDPFDKEFDAWLMPGAITEIVLPQQISTFYDSLNIYNELIMSDMIESGADAVSTHMHPFFVMGSTYWEYFYESYLPLEPSQATLNLAESYYRSIERISWMELLVGDPKTSIENITTGSSKYYLPKVVTWLSDLNTLTVKNAMPFTSGSSWIIYSIQGQAVKQGNIAQSKNQFNTDITGLEPGMYIIHIEDIENRGAVGKFIKN